MNQAETKKFYFKYEKTYSIISIYTWILNES